MTDQLRKAMEEDALGLEQNFPTTPIHVAYKCGSDYLRLHAWHDAEEEPEPGKEIIIKTAKGMKIHPNAVKSLMEWSYFVRITRCEAWAYTEEFLPDPAHVDIQIMLV